MCGCLCSLQDAIVQSTENVPDNINWHHDIRSPQYGAETIFHEYAGRLTEFTLYYIPLGVVRFFPSLTQ